MAESITETISRMLGNNPSTRKVADDLQLTSELILLVRMMFADGQLKPGEMEAFKSICVKEFGLDEADIPGVLAYLKDFGYETSSWDAANMFVDHSTERKKELLVHLLKIAKSDQHLDMNETELIRRTAKILELSPQDLDSTS